MLFPGGLAWDSNGFLIPKGWTGRGLHPSGSGWVETITNYPSPPSQGVITHTRDMGHNALVYTNQGGTQLPDLAGALRIPSCTVTSHTVLTPDAVTYSCAPEGGLTIRGTVLVKPYPQGVEWVEARLPVRMDLLAEEIVGSLAVPPLVPGPYGFDVPKNPVLITGTQPGGTVISRWVVGTQRAGATIRATGELFRISDTPGRGQGVVNADGTLNVAAALAQTGCQVISEMAVTRYEMIYECELSATGQLMGAVVLPSTPNAGQAWKRVAFYGAPTEIATATKILGSLRWHTP